MNGVDARGGRFLVTGGSGFVGSHVVDGLVASGAECVTVLDARLRQDRLSGALASGRVAAIEGDMLGEALARTCQGVDGVFHLATLTLPECDRDPIAAVRINVEGTARVLAAAHGAGTRKVVFSSASSVYGETQDTTDESTPLAPMTVYGRTKAAAEYVVRAFSSRIAAVSLRYMNVYGPRQEGGLIPSVLAKIRAGESPVIAGDGTQSFDFINVRDVAAANLAAMAADVPQGEFNVGSNTEASVAEVVCTLLRLSRSDVAPVFDRGAPAGVARRAGSSELAARVLGWRAAVGLEEGLVELVRG